MINSAYEWLMMIILGNFFHDRSLFSLTRIIVSKGNDPQDSLNSG